MTLPERPVPVSREYFDQAMQQLQPFERSPHLAVAVSGGADSMALAVLAWSWAAERGGRTTALIVDHGLRAESAQEAALTKSRLGALGIEAHVLVWDGDKPEHGIQAAARRARYRLMDHWCRDHGVLHLLVGHHADDQAETFMMRVRRGSGPDGLAAMAAVRELSACRVLRPLLGIAKARLIATLRQRGIDWVEDPSNRNPKYARTAIRQSLAERELEAAEAGIATERFARVRQVLETETARWLARFAGLDPCGFARIDRAAFIRAPEEIRLRVLARLSRCIGGGVYGPDIAAVERLLIRLESGKGATLGGARFHPLTDGIGIFREVRNLPGVRGLTTGTLKWDRRFLIFVSQDRLVAAPMTIQAWSPEMSAAWPVKERPDWYRALPMMAQAGLPHVESRGMIMAFRPGHVENHGVSTRFAPTMALSGGGFSVA